MDNAAVISNLFNAFKKNLTRKVLKTESKRIRKKESFLFFVSA